MPNLCSDMHDCSVSTGDTWLKNNLGAYATWAKTHNSLLVVTFDEDNPLTGNRIPTVLLRAAGHARAAHLRPPTTTTTCCARWRTCTAPRTPGNAASASRHHRHLGELTAMYVADSPRRRGRPRPGRAASRAPGRRHRPHRLRPRRGQPDHRHLLGDGHRGAAALPGHRARPVAARLRPARRRLQRLQRPGTAGRRPPRRPGRRAGTSRSRRLGYGLSALCKPLLLLAHTLPLIGAVLAADRTGKGLRTAPRDALISLSSAPRAPGPRVRRAPGDGHRRRAARPARRLR